MHTDFRVISVASRIPTRCLLSALSWKGKSRMSGSYIASSLASLSESTSLFASIKFDRQCPLSEAVLSSERQFEQSFIRDAEPHELALFEAPVESLPNDEDTAMKRVGPQPVAALNKDRASPLKDRKAADDPQRCLVAARKLLDV